MESTMDAMTHNRLYWETAATVCTTAEFDALRLKHIQGLGYTRIALNLGISREAARWRIHNADRKIADALAKENDAA